MQFGVLGPLVVRTEHGAVDIGGARQRRLLAVLLANHGQIVSLDRLVDMVFDGEPPRSASTTMRSYVARLRRAFTEADADAGGLIATEQGGYGLRVDPEHVDAARFEASIETAQAQLANRDPIAATATLRRGLDLWRGEAYGEFAHEDWAHAEAMRLDERRTAAEEELNESLLACGLANDVVTSTRAQIARHPLNERLRSQHMLALYRAGRQVEALRSLDDFEETLIDVGLEPSTEIRALGRSIAAHDPALRLDAPAGQPLRGYRVGASIGEGAHGVVYRAVQPGVGREVAVKTIRAQLADEPEFVRGFDAEAQLVANLEHPHIVPIYDYWREPGGAYIVMRLLDGNLASRLEGGPLDVSSVASVARELGSALHAAHRAGVVHGDIKPTNVLVDDERAYLADFGVASLVESTSEDRGPSPSSGFESPEQLAGQPASPASDQFAFAVLLFQLLTGTLPFGTRAIATAHDRAPAVHVQRPSVPAAVDDVLWRATQWEPAQRFDDVETFVAQFVAAIEGRSAAERPVTILANPYKGLEAFTEADQANFFGRRSVTDELVSQLGRPGTEGRFVIAVGASGSGKSSVVRAGLVPRLRSGAVDGSERWLVATMVPGADPFASLQQALRSVATEERRPNPSGIGDEPFEQLLHRAVPYGAPILLVIDQLEELFTLVDDDWTRQEFLHGLTRAVEDPHSGLRVAATLRADYLDRPLRSADFGQLVKRGAVAIVGMSASEIGEAITQPAAGAGVEVEPALVTQIVADVVDQPAALPLLQFALTELFELRSSDARRIMTLEDYRTLGGIDAAIASRADSAVAVLPEASRELSRRVFLRLVDVDNAGTVTRRRVRRSQLTALSEDDSVDRLLDTFGAGRLLTFDHDPDTREPTVEVAHEALIQQWPRFQQWVREAGDGLRVQQQIAAAAATWDEQGRDDTDLVRGLRLESALELAESTPDAYDRLEREFVAASDRLRTAEADAERAQAEHDRRANRRLKGLLAGVALLLVVALVVGFFAVGQRNDARNANTEAELAKLVSDSAAATADDPELAILLALEAHRRSPEPATEQAVLNALGRSELSNRIATFPAFDIAEDCPGFQVDEDGLTERGISDGRFVSRDLNSGEIVDHGPAPVDCGDWFGDVATDRSVVASAGGTRTWIGTLDDPAATEIEPFFGTVTFPSLLAGDRFLATPDGVTFAAGDATTGEVVGEPFDLEGAQYGVIAADGNFMAVVTSDGDDVGGLHVIDNRTGAVAYTIDTEAVIGAVVFDIATDELLVAVEGVGLQTYDTATGDLLAETEITSTSEMRSLGVREDGLVVAASLGQIQIIDRRTGPVVQPTELRDVINAIARRDGRVLTVLADLRLEVIDPDAGVLIERAWTIADGAQVSINSRQAGVIDRFTRGSPEVLDLATGQRTPVETASEDDQLLWVYPEDGGVWTIAPNGELVLRTGDVEIERIELGAEILTGTRFQDRMALVVGRPASSVWLVDLSPAQPRPLFEVDAPGASTAHPSVDGGVHVLDADGTLRTYDAAGDLVSDFETGATGVAIITLDPSSRTLAVGSNPGGVVLIDTETGDVERLPGGDSITNLGFARDGAMLVITGADGTVRLWDVERGAPAGLVWDGTGSVFSSPSWYDPETDSIWVATSGLLMEVPLDPQRWIDEACELVGRDLTQDEWERWIPDGGTPRSACG